MNKGTATMDVLAESLPAISTMLPSTYRIVGSEANQAIGVVRLIVESEDLAGHDMHVVCEIKNAGSTRTVVVVPCGRRDTVKG